jgi:hypothetical protein
VRFWRFSQPAISSFRPLYDVNGITSPLRS